MSFPKFKKKQDLSLPKKDNGYREYSAFVFVAL
jgi:hypothetical protein